VQQSSGALCWRAAPLAAEASRRCQQPVLVNTCARCGVASPVHTASRATLARCGAVGVGLRTWSDSQTVTKCRCRCHGRLIPEPSASAPRLRGHPTRSTRHFPSQDPIAIAQYAPARSRVSARRADASVTAAQAASELHATEISTCKRTIPRRSSEGWRGGPGPGCGRRAGGDLQFSGAEAR
jgi:hypothetical protein